MEGNRKKHRSGAEHEKDKTELQNSIYNPLKEIQCLLKK